MFYNRKIKLCIKKQLKIFRKNMNFILPSLIWTFICWCLWSMAKSYHSLSFLYGFNNSIAALLGLIGTIQIYRYGVPNRTKHDEQPSLILESPAYDEEKEKQITQNYKNKADRGLGMIAASFLIMGFLTS